MERADPSMNMIKKKCHKCKEIKYINEFNKKNQNKGGYNPQCKKCVRKYRKKYYKNNPEKYYQKYYQNNPKIHIEASRRWQKKNWLKVQETNKRWKMNHPEKIKEYRKRWRMKGGESLKKAKEQTKEWCRKNPERVRNLKRKFLLNIRNRLNGRMSGAIWTSLIHGKNGNHWENLVGYTLKDLICHLEKQFTLGMNWDNYGKWHIDHIKPKVLFKFETYCDKEFKQCWNLSNLQPLWAEENKKKGSKFVTTT